MNENLYLLFPPVLTVHVEVLNLPELSWHCVLDCCLSGLINPFTVHLYMYSRSLKWGWWEASQHGSKLTTEKEEVADDADVRSLQLQQFACIANGKLDHYTCCLKRMQMGRWKILQQIGKCFSPCLPQEPLPLFQVLGTLQKLYAQTCQTSPQCDI